MTAKNVGQKRFFVAALRLLRRERIPHLVGGAFGLFHYTGIRRDTKDIDLFLRRPDVPKALEALSRAGLQTKLVSPHWLAKAFSGREFIDIIFACGNGLCPVDEEWFEHSSQGEVWGVPVRFVPPEEMVWSKAFIMERERYDGADVAHMLHACGGRMDWDRLLRRFGEHWPVLLSHVILYRYTFPSDPAVSDEVVFELLSRARRLPKRTGKLCRGTLLSRSEYLFDLESLGYEDGRLRPSGRLGASEVERMVEEVKSAKPPDPPAVLRPGA